MYIFSTRHLKGIVLTLDISYTNRHFYIISVFILIIHKGQTYVAFVLVYINISSVNIPVNYRSLAYTGIYRTVRGMLGWVCHFQNTIKP